MFVTKPELAIKVDPCSRTIAFLVVDAWSRWLRASTLAVEEAEEERQESREVSDNKEPDLFNQHFSVDEKIVVNLLTTAMEVTKLGA